MSILVTRPEPGLSATCARLVALGFSPIPAPVLAIRALPARLPADVQAVLVTSANALPGLPASLHGVRLLAVGDATAERARAAGFARVDSAGADAVALRGLVGRVCAPGDGALLLAGGRGTGAGLARALRRDGFRVRWRAVYAVEPAAALVDAARAGLEAGAVGAALFFSPATAAAFVRLAAGVAPGLFTAVAALAISQATARALTPLPWRSIRVASHPDQASLLALLTGESA